MTLTCFRCGNWPCTCKNGQTIIHGDCREILPELGTFDLCLTDPPYGIGYENNRDRDLNPHRTFSDEIAGDSSGIGQEVVNLAFECGLPVCVFAHHRNPFVGEWRQWLVWDKGPAVGGGGDIQTCWKFTWELIQVGGFGKLNGQRDSAVLKYWISQRDMHFHPTQKPVELLAYLVGKLSEGGQTILDPFLGSGTTLRACKDLGRRGTGIEIEERYCEIAANRLRQEVLF